MNTGYASLKTKTKTVEPTFGFACYIRTLHDRYSEHLIFCSNMVGFQ